MDDEEDLVCQIYPPEDAQSLVKCSMNSILHNLVQLEPELKYLPTKLKVKLFHLMTKRGLVSDNNISFLLHKDILELDLTESSVTDTSLLEVQQCGYLQKLNLNSMKKNRTDITSEVLDQLLEMLPYLRVLYLRRCSLVDDRPICTLAARCGFLMELNLSGCSMVTDVGVVALAKHASLLQCLNLSRTKVSDFGLVSLANGVCNKQLSEVQVPYCEKVTDKGISVLSNNCPKLTILIFHGCPSISPDIMASNWMVGNSVSSMKMVTWTVH